MTQFHPAQLSLFDNAPATPRPAEERYPDGTRVRIQTRPESSFSARHAGKIGTIRYCLGGNAPYAYCVDLDDGKGVIIWQRHFTPVF